MFKIKYIFITIIFYLLIPAIILRADEGGSSVVIKINANRELGLLPYLFRPAFYINTLPEGYPMYKFFKDNKPGLIQLNWDHYPELHNAQSFEEFLTKLPKSSLSQWAEKVEKSGGEVLITPFHMPIWLRKEGSSSAFIMPPNDYNKWAEYVESLVNYFNNKLGLNAKYILWDEPDLDDFFGGTEDEYFKLYKYTVLGAKTADKNVKIGGPGLSYITANKKGDSKSLLYNFIEYASQTSLPEIGLEKLPIDFIVWHHFNPNPYNTTFYKDGDMARNWLRKFGYDTTTELNIGSWNSWMEFPVEESHERDTNYLASYILPVLIVMDKAGIQRHAFFNLFEDWQQTKRKEEFFGGFGLFTKHYVIKPAYNTFRAISMLGGSRLEIQSKDSFISAIATKEGEKISILFSNFIPAKQMLTKQIVKYMVEKGYKKDDLRKYKLSTKKINDVIDGKVSLDNMKIPENLKRDIKEAMTLFHKIRKRQEESIAVKIDIEGLPLNDQIKYERYLIDDGHSNSYAIRDKVERAIKDANKMADDEGYAYLLKSWNGDEVQNIQKMRNKKMNIEEILKRVPFDKRQDLKNAINIREKIFYKKIDEINEWPEVRLQKVEEKTIQTTGDYQEIQTVKPNSLTLIILSK